MFHRLRPDLVGFESWFVWCYLLLGPDGGVVLVDAGMGSTDRPIRRWFERTGRGPKHLRAILLTHGHLDHIGGAEPLRRWANCPVFLHPADHAIAEGRFRYEGAARICGASEAVGRLIFPTRSPRKLTALTTGETLPYWGGLEVLHLPGHTPGHVGFFSPTKRILFCGDLLLCWGRRAAFPLGFLNTDSAAVRTSTLSIENLLAAWVYPGHHRGMRHNLMDDVRQYAQKRRSATSSPA